MGAVVIPYLRSLGLEPGRCGVYQSAAGLAGVAGSLGGGVAIMVGGVLQIMMWQVLVRETLGREVTEPEAVPSAALAPARGMES
jgi:hypothetical protein